MSEIKVPRVELPERYYRMGLFKELEKSLGILNNSDHARYSNCKEFTIHKVYHNTPKDIDDRYDFLFISMNGGPSYKRENIETIVNYFNSGMSKVVKNYSGVSLYNIKEDNIFLKIPKSVYSKVFLIDSLLKLVRASLKLKSRNLDIDKSYTRAYENMAKVENKHMDDTEFKKFIMLMEGEFQYGKLPDITFSTIYADLNSQGFKKSTVLVKNKSQSKFSPCYHYPIKQGRSGELHAGDRVRITHPHDSMGTDWVGIEGYIYDLNASRIPLIEFSDYEGFMPLHRGKGHFPTDKGYFIPKNKLQKV